MMAIIIWCLVLMIEGIHSHAIFNNGGNPFDGGPQYQCERAKVESGSLCYDVVNYNVPIPIAKLSKIIETAIYDNLQQAVVEECMDIYRKVLCLHRFPRCQRNPSNNKLSVLLHNATYTAALVQTCPSYVNRIFTDPTVVALTEDCFPLLAFPDLELKMCSLNPDSQLSTWMLEYVKAVDRTLSQESGYLFFIPVCGKKYAFHKCNFIGRCSSEGRVKFFHSYESCKNITAW